MYVSHFPGLLWTFFNCFLIEVDKYEIRCHYVVNNFFKMHESENLWEYSSNFKHMFNELIVID